MTYETKELKATVTLSGTLVYHDKDGQEVGRADFSMPVDMTQEPKEDHGNQRSE